LGEAIKKYFNFEIIFINDESEERKWELFKILEELSEKDLQMVYNGFADYFYVIFEDSFGNGTNVEILKNAEVGSKNSCYNKSMSKHVNGLAEAVKRHLHLDNWFTYNREPEKAFKILDVFNGISENEIDRFYRETFENFTGITEMIGYGFLKLFDLLTADEVNKTICYACKPLDLNNESALEKTFEMIVDNVIHYPGDKINMPPGFSIFLPDSLYGEEWVSGKLTRGSIEDFRIDNVKVIKNKSGKILRRRLSNISSTNEKGGYTFACENKEKTPTFYLKSGYTKIEPGDIIIKQYFFDKTLNGR